MQNDKKPGLSWSNPAPSQPGAPASTKPATPALKSLPMPAAGASNSVSKYIGIFAGGVIIGVLVAWGYSAIGRGSSPKVSTGSTGTMMTDASTTAMATSSTLDVPSPQAAGWSVTIANALVQEPTWVVVYDNVNGKPGNVLGAQLFQTSGAGTVTLLRGTVGGVTYFIGESPDNGDHKFAKATDMPVLGADGSVALTSFVAQ